jgi:hypothetical protein
MAVSDEPVGRLGRNNLEALIEFHISYSQYTFDECIGGDALIDGFFATGYSKRDASPELLSSEALTACLRSD